VQEWRPTVTAAQVACPPELLNPPFTLPPRERNPTMNAVASICWNQLEVGG
jgi:hypothetical protein